MNWTDEPLNCHTSTGYNPGFVDIQSSSNYSISSLTTHRKSHTVNNTTTWYNNIIQIMNWTDEQLHWNGQTPTGYKPGFVDKTRKMEFIFTVENKTEN